MAIEISIITINYNGLKDTCELIDTLPLGDESIEVIVVDNASMEDEATLIAQHYPQVKVIRSIKNLGFAGGNNLGIKAAQGKYLYFVNNDTIFKDANFYKSLINRLESSKKIGMVCPKICYAWGNHPIQFAGYTPLSSVTLRNRCIGMGEEDHGQYDSSHPTPYAHGAAMMIKREVIERVGFMPECYFLYYEELDWSLMIRRAGYDIWFEPSCTIYHKESQATGQASPLKAYYMMRNRLLFAKRNIAFPTRCLTYSYLIGIVATRILLQYVIKRQPKHCSATIHGVIDFMKLL